MMKIVNNMILLTSLSILLILGVSTQFTFDFDALAQTNPGFGHFHSLKEILKDRETGDPFACPNPEHVLVLRPNSNWACVYFETAKQLGWDTVLYSESNAPQITTFVFIDGNSIPITYQANEGVVESVENLAPIDDPSFYLKISLAPTQEGDLTITLPAADSDVFENFCARTNLIPDTEHFVIMMFPVIEKQLEHYEYLDSNNIKFRYEHDTTSIEIIIFCSI